MKFFSGSSPILLALFGILVVSHGPRATDADASLTTKEGSDPSLVPTFVSMKAPSLMTSSPTKAPSVATSSPTKAPSMATRSPTAAAPAPPAVADDLLQEEKDENENPVVVIDMKVAGATREQVEAVAALVQYIANMPFHVANVSKINVTVEWRGTVVEGGASPTRSLRALPTIPVVHEEDIWELLNDKDKNKGKKQCSLNVGDTANVTTITIHGLYGSAQSIKQVEDFLSFLSSGIINIWTGTEHLPAFNFVCASEVRMSNEAPSMQFQVMNAEEDDKRKRTGPNAAAIAVPVVFGVVLLGAVGFVLVKKFGVGV